MATLSLDPHGDTFILRKTRTDGVSAELVLTTQDMILLGQMYQAFHPELLRRQGLEPVSRVVRALDVAEAILADESEGQKILATFAFDAEGKSRLTLAFDSQVASDLVSGMTAHLASLAKRTPQ